MQNDKCWSVKKTKALLLNFGH